VLLLKLAGVRPLLTSCRVVLQRVLRPCDTPTAPHGVARGIPTNK